MQAAPATEGSHYALAAIRKAKIRAGQRVLVNGATGAIGSAAVQLLAARGVHVTGGLRQRAPRAGAGLGAERVIDRDAEDFTQDDQTLRRGVRRGRQELVRPVPAAADTARCVYLSTDLGPGGQNPFLALVTPCCRAARCCSATPGTTRR